MLPAGYFYDRAIKAERRIRFPEVFGDGDCRPSEVVHNGGWFNQIGQEIGWGDLNVARLKAFSERLHGDDIVIISSEGARCDYKHNKISWDEILLEHVFFILKDGKVHRPSDRAADEPTSDWGSGLVVFNIHPDQINDLITSPVAGV